MSNRDRCIELIDSFDDDSLCAVIAYLEKLNDDLDMEYCLALAREADDDPESGDTIPLEDFAKQLGVV